MSKLSIMIEMIYKGAGAQKATKDLKGLEAQGGKSANKMDMMKSGLMQLGVAAGAAGAAIVIAKKAFDMGAEGAKLQQVTESFDRMNESIWKTPSLLRDMQEATRNTVSEAQLMSGILTLSAGASDTLAGKLAEAAPKLAEIAKAANKLNPTLGDTGFMFESIATGVKRASPMILDNLGIMVKIGPANEAYAAALGKTVEQLTAEEKQLALLNEVMRSGGKLIEQVGGDVSAAGDKYEQSAAQLKDLTNEFKMLVSDGISPAVSAMASFLTAVNISRNIKASDKELRAMAISFGMTEEQVKALEKALMDYVLANQDVYDAEEAVTEINRLFKLSVDEVGKGATELGDDLVKLTINEEKLSVVNESMTKGYDAMAAAEGRVVDSTIRVVGTTGEWIAAQERLDNALMDSWSRTDDLVIKTGELIEAEENVVPAVDAAKEAYEDMWGPTGELATRNESLASAVARVKLELYGIPLPAAEAASAYGLAAKEMWLEANRVADETARINDELDELDGRNVEFNVFMNRMITEQLATPGQTTGSDGTTGTIGEFAGHSGADFTVPPGYPNDSFRMRVESGEHVQVTPKGQGKGGNTVNVTVYTGSGNADLIGNKVAGRVAEVLGVRG